MLKGESIFLRVVEKSDDTTLFLWENDTENWRISDTEIPFSMHSIHQLIEQQSDLRSCGQLRFMICRKLDDIAIGTIDLYDVNFKHKNASVGILIADKSERKKGYASAALDLVINYCRETLELRNLQCFIHGDNEESTKLFCRKGFSHVGKRIDWLQFKGKFYDLDNFQLAL